jgi:phenylacetate-coenzyme A ligase PaaK-like adenylate-forming protein
MTEVWVPETFRDRPYAREHFIQIVRWAQRYHGFYQKFHVDVSKPLPIIKRAQVQQYNDLLLNGHEALGHTSGSTSMPVKVSWQVERHKMESVDTQRLIDWYGGQLTPMKIVALATHEANDSTLEVDTPLHKQWEFIQEQHARRGADSLISYPTNLERLCHYAIEKGLTLPFVKRVTAMSETYDAHMDDLLKKVFPNAVPIVTYSSIECGTIAIRCPHNPDNYHVMAHKLGVEILNDEGQPCALGELGQVVVTDYFNQHSSLIRYALGDLAEPAQCDCGKINFPAITKIAGKMRGLLRRNDGSQMLFTSLSATFRDSPEISQFQVIQTQLQDFTVNAVLKANQKIEDFEARIIARFQQEFGTEATVSFTYMDSVPRSSGGKYFAAICAIPEFAT